MINPNAATMRVRGSQRGVSLIELMVAIAIAMLLTLGLIQIFSASRVSSMTQESLSRVQENGRYVVQYLQRELRMVGYMGCGADAGRLTQSSNFVNHLARFNGTLPSGDRHRFQRPIEAFTAGAATPPAEFSAAETASFVTGSDVLILRTFSGESSPVLSVSRASPTNLVINIADTSASAPFLPSTANNVLFAMQNCRSADVFAGSLSGSTLTVAGATNPNVYLDPTVSGCGGAGCPWDFRISNATLNSTPITGGAARLNAQVHRAEYIALYVRDGGLFIKRFERNGTGFAAPVNLVDGVEQMQLRFGFDTSPVPDGTIDEYRTAAEVVDGVVGDVAIDLAWQRVLSVRVALLLRSPERGGVSTDRTYDLLGVEVGPYSDGAMRQVYETTIGLRNRLFNS